MNSITRINYHGYTITPSTWFEARYKRSGYLITNPDTGYSSQLASHRLFAWMAALTANQSGERLGCDRVAAK